MKPGTRVRYPAGYMLHPGVVVSVEGLPKTVKRRGQPILVFTGTTSRGGPILEWFAESELQPLTDTR